MNNVEVVIVVEGQTEQTFVRDVLAKAMARRGVYLTAVLIGKPGHKGGDIRFERAKKDIGNFLKQRPDTYVSTMFDYFRIESDWPGRNRVNHQIETGVSLTSNEKGKILEEETYNIILTEFGQYNAVNRFIPYIEMHEFEAMLFSDIDILAQKINVNISLVRDILAKYDNPEEINDTPGNAPSRRILAMNRSYRKVAMGKAISEMTGIDLIRQKCPHFNYWINKFERLAE